jgi:glycosyltransferase involved in cell wall biosynthesis
MSAKKPLISIVLPTYNGEKYLAQALDSCIHQTYQSIEIIVVNDASTDSTPEIVETYKKKDGRIRMITNEANKKLPESLNIGHRHSKGQYITWTSDDNFYEPEAMAILMDAALANPRFDIFYTNYIEMDENDNIIRLRKFGGFGPYNLIHGNCIGACFVYKSEVFHNLNGYDTELFLAEDYDFWVRASAQFKFLHINASPYNYRFHKNSLTSSYTDKIKDAIVSTQIKNMQIFNGYPKKFKIRLYSKLIRFFGAKKDFRNTRKFYGKLFCIGFQPFLHNVFINKKIFFNCLIPGNKRLKLKQV